MIYTSVVRSVSGNLTGNLTGNVVVAVFGILLVLAEDARNVAEFGRIRNVLPMPEDDKVSPHLDWYEGLDDIVEQLKEEIKERWRVKEYAHA